MVPSRPKRSGPQGFGRYAHLLVSLGHPTRLGILELLSKEPLHVNRIQSELRVERTHLSHHLRCLRKGGLITARHEGKTIRYQLAPAILYALQSQRIQADCCELR